jgi:hypothetical protein
MLNSNQFRNLILKPALSDMQMYSVDAAELLIFTCANESDGGTYLHQLNGPALGIYQMEPNTYNDLWQNYIYFKPDLKLKLLHNFNAPVMPPEDRLIYDLRYATVMARLFYARVNEPLPNFADIDGIWRYYKKHYNTAAGKADYQVALNAYYRFRITKS